MATASQKMILQAQLTIIDEFCRMCSMQHTGLGNVVYLMRFFDVMRGTRMAAPSRLLPVINMPL